MIETTIAAPSRRAIRRLGLRLIPVLAAIVPFTAQAQTQVHAQAQPQPFTRSEPLLASSVSVPALLAAPAPTPALASNGESALTAATTLSSTGNDGRAVSAPSAAQAVPAAQPVALRSRALAPEEAPRAPHVSRQSSTALMIVGFAAMIVGAVVDGDAGTLIMVGGAGVGLYGLYHYLN